MNALERVANDFLAEHPRTSARLLETYEPDALAGLLRRAPARAVAETLQRMSREIGARCLSAVEPAVAAAIFVEMLLDFRVLMLRRSSEEERERVLSALPADVAEQSRRLLRYPEGTAGELMDAFVFTAPEDVSVSETLERAAAAGRGVDHNVYVVSREQRLVGVVTVPELLAAPGPDRIDGVMRRDVKSLRAEATQAEVAVSPFWREFSSLPVVEGDGTFLGVIRFEALARLRAELGTEEDHGGMEAVLALGELYWQGLSGMLEGMAPTRGGSEGGTSR